MRSSPMSAKVQRLLLERNETMIHSLPVSEDPTNIYKYSIEYHVLQLKVSLKFAEGAKTELSL